MIVSTSHRVCTMKNIDFTDFFNVFLSGATITAEAFLWWAIQGPNTHGLMNSPLDCSLPRSRSAVLSSPAWPFYKKSFHLTAEAFLWWAIQGSNTHGLMNSPLDCSSPRSRSAVLSSPAWPFYKKSFHLRGVQLRKHSKAREKRYSFGYAVSFIFACYQILWTFPKSRYLCSRYLPLVCG